MRRRPTRSSASACLARGLLALVCGLVLAIPSVVHAQPVNITLSRLRLAAGSPEALSAPAGACQGGNYCADFDAYRSLMAQLGGAVAPTLLHPARTLGSRHFYVGVAASVAGVSDQARYWQLGTEGDSTSTLDEGNLSPDAVVGSYTVSFRQGMPLGLQLGADVGHVVRSNLWVWGVEAQWALLEGYRRGPFAYLPDVALRFAVRVLTGDADFTLTVPAAELILSKPITLSSTTVLTPMLGTSLFWSIARSGSVDLSPDQPAVSGAGCQPTPPSLDPADASPFPFGGCGAGDASGFADNVRFPSFAARRMRASIGLNLRHRAFVVSGAFQVDLSRPSGLGSPVPEAVTRQWTAQLGTGLSY